MYATAVGDGGSGAGDGEGDGDAEGVGVADGVGVCAFVIVVISEPTSGAVMSEVAIVRVNSRLDSLLGLFVLELGFILMFAC